MNIFFLFLFTSLSVFGAGQKINGDLTVNGKISAISTTRGSKPCPVMTETQRNAVSTPTNGDCVFNSTANTLNVYSSTDVAWNEVAGAGGSVSDLLINSGFEKGITGWTLAAGTNAENTAEKLEGKKSLTITLTAQTLSLLQDTTTNAAAHNGKVQGLTYIMVNPTVAGVKLCARQAGVTINSICTREAIPGEWNLFRLPFMLSATSSGLELKTSSAVTGTVKVDKGFLGAEDLKTDSDSSRIAGESFFAGTTSCDWNKALTTTMGTLNASTPCPGPTIVGRPSMGTWLTTDSDLPRQTIQNLPAGKYKATFIFGSYNSGNGSNGFAITDGTTMCEPVEAPNYNGAINPMTFSCTFEYASPGTRNFEPMVGSVSNTGTFSLVNNRTAPRNSTKFILEYFGNSSTYVTTASGDPARVSEVIFTGNPSTPDGFISALNKSIGLSGATFNGDAYYPLYEVLWNMPGTVTTAGSTYRISSAKGASSLADWNAAKTITIDYETSGAFIRAKSAARSAGTYESSDNLAHTHNLERGTGTGSVTRIHDGVSAAATTAVSYTFNGITSSGGSESKPNATSLYAYIRFAASKEILIGQFNGLESCKDSFECESTFSIKVGGDGAIKDPNIPGWVTSCTSGSPSTCTFKTGLFTVAPNCTASPQGTINPVGHQVQTTTNTTVTVRTENSSNNTTFPSGFQLNCQKQGADYIAKTAKAVASDQNVRTVGAIGVDMQTIQFGSGSNCTAPCTTGTCTICFQVGTKITSVTHDAGVGRYRINGLDGLTKYRCMGSAANQAYDAVISRADQSTTSYAYLAANEDLAYAMMICVGTP